ncbi:MAG TPA: SpoIIE family protein phosphatase [Pyrinomonadaceae bacterium]
MPRNAAVKNQFRYWMFSLAALLATTPFLYAQQQPEIFSLTAQSFEGGKSVALEDLRWKYQAGDAAAFADKDFDDSGWKSVTNDEINDAPVEALENWDGRAWFRLRLRVDESAVGKPLAARMWHWGATEIYLNGKLIQSYGVINADGSDTEYNPRGLYFPIAFDSAGTHTIAVRYSFQTMSDLTSGRASWVLRGGTRPGFMMALTDARDISLRQENRAHSERTDYIFIGLLWALALVHFLLFVFYRAARGNLFYSLFVLGLGLTMWLVSLGNTAHFGAIPYMLRDILRINVQSLAILALLAFLYVEFRARFSRIFWILCALWAIVIVLQWMRIRVDFDYTLLMLAVSIADALRIMIIALWQRRDGAWIIAAGIGFFAVGVALNITIERKFLQVPQWLYNLNLYSTVLSVPLTVSLYLARNFARTNRHLEAQLVQVQELSIKQLEQERVAAELQLAHEREKAENERRAKELEEARQLQLSMLPKKLPRIAGLEIAAYMKPATEVGGDYYDFHVSEDGTLTVAVGDATGHGLKAGSVVTATKSLFNAFAGEPDIARIFQKTSAALKKMNLRGLFMAMAMLKIKDYSAEIGIAGMPPVLIYRSASERVEEIGIKALPLGAIAKLAYQKQELQLFKGDCLLLLSDGFPEMFNGQNEMLGFEKAAEILPLIAHRTPQEIIDYFIKAGESWANGRPQDDDVTFVVVKVAETLN